MAEYNFQTFRQMNLCSGVTVTDFALVFWPNDSLQCMSHRICPGISNKQMGNITVTEAGFVFDNKTVREHLKKLKVNSLVSFLYSYF